MEKYVSNRDIREMYGIGHTRASEIIKEIKTEYDIDDDKLPRRHTVPLSLLEKYLKSAVRKKRDALTDKSVASQGW